MKPYRTVDEVLADRRKGAKLSEVIDNLLYSPCVLERFENPFDIIRDFHPNDYLDASTEAWEHLPVEAQIQYSKAYQHWYAKYAGFYDIKGVFVNSGNIQMILIPPMRYWMGTKNKTRDFNPPEPKRILVKKPFWMGQFVVTTSEFWDVMYNEHHDSMRPAQYTANTNREDFCKAVGCRLPRQYEWELACRAGTTTDFSFGDDQSKLRDYGWYNGNNHTETPSIVGQKLSNPWSLYDMHGNVWEWCKDGYIRGGCWLNEGKMCTSYSSMHPRDSNIGIAGFRVLKEI